MTHASFGYTAEGRRFSKKHEGQSGVESRSNKSARRERDVSHALCVCSRCFHAGTALAKKTATFQHAKVATKAWTFFSSVRPSISQNVKKLEKSSVFVQVLGKARAGARKSHEVREKVLLRLRRETNHAFRDSFAVQLTASKRI